MSMIREEEENFLGGHFRYYSNAYRDEVPLEIVKGENLQTKKGVQETLDRLHTYLNSELMLTTASSLTKRYGYYIVTGPIAMMTLFNKFPDVSPSNMELVRLDEHEKWLPKLHFKSKHVTTPQVSRRGEWIEQQMEQLFKHHVRPMFLHINQLTRLAEKVMWENVAIYLFWFYERQLKEWYSGSELERMQKDFDYILNHLSGDVFGTENNPFHYFQYQPVLPTEARERKCCCLSYRLHKESSYCKVCPHLLKKQRS